jgi:hypothetical protein
MIRSLKRKWCEWSHVHSWKGICLIGPGKYDIRMSCSRCGREWDVHQ